MNAVGGNFARQYEVEGPAAGAAETGTGQQWYSAVELAELALPGLQGDKRSINRRARDDRWTMRAGADGELLARRRIGRGGGTEFHVSLLPAQARLALTERGLLLAAPVPAAMGVLGTAEAVSAGRWRWYDAQTAGTKAKAAFRVKVVAEVEVLEAAGLTRTAAIAEAAPRHGQSTATLWGWLRLIEGVPRGDRLPALAPRYQGGGKAAAIDPAIWELFKSDYLRDSAPTLAICYAKAAARAAEMGLSVPSEKAFKRRFDKECPLAVRLLARRGAEALRRSLPAQRRSVAEYHALELVNVDGHKFDVFAERPDGSRFRPILIGIQDVYSRKLLAWRIGDVESAVLTRLAFADLFGKFGIPLEAYLDNGRAFASKWITGQMLNRYRFKVKEDEPSGLLTTLGVKVHWTLPYRGQSKPIERAWKDLCDSISKCAAFDGAYTGNSTSNKPESYGKRAVPIAEFVAEVERGIAFHNAREGRRSEMARGRSFDQTFAESYASAPIGKATTAHLRLALLTGENRRCNAQTGELGLFGSRYWSPVCADLRGQLVTVRFDPDDLTRPVHLYDLAGRYLGDAENIADVPFKSADDAQGAARLVAEYRKSTKLQLDAQRRMSAAEVAREQRRLCHAPELPEPAVIRPVPVRYQRGTTAAVKLAPAPAEHVHKSTVFTALGMLKAVE